jgi:DNA-binding LacI/PurR family transcriptional regulator
VTGRTTLEHVAARAQVSRQTVSNVINSPQIVRPETKDRVLAAIAELDYRPNVAARQLVTRRSRVLGFAVPPGTGGTRYAVGSAFLNALTEAAQAEGYRLMLFSAADDGAEIAQYADLLDGADLDGFVLANTHRDDPRSSWLGRRGVPFVTFGRPWGDRSAEHHWVDVDGAAGTTAAVEHLRDLGHGRIAFVGWPQGSGVGDDRRAGWEAAVRAGGATAAEVARWRTETPDVLEHAVPRVRSLLEQVAPTALVCVSDTVALAALRARHELGREVAVVGFDDAPFAEPLGLTSLRQPLEEAARRCLELVLHPERAQRPARVLLAPQLVTRTSSMVTPATLATTTRRQS